VLISTAATVIASQAVITGAFSVARQATAFDSIDPPVVSHRQSQF